MPRNVQAGAGGRGVPRGGQMEKDIVKMSDSAKRKKRQEAQVKKGLAAVFPKKKVKPARRPATFGMTSREKANYYDLQAAKNRKMAGDVDRSKTGNIKAAARHREVAKQYVTKAKKLRAKLATRKDK